MLKNRPLCPSAASSRQPQTQSGEITNCTERWLLCPFCGSKTRVKLRQDTELRNFPLFCPKCKREVLVTVRNFVTISIAEPDAKTQCS